MAKTVKKTLSPDLLEALASDASSPEAFAQSFMQSALFAAALKIKAKRGKAESVDLPCSVNITVVPGLGSLGVGGDCVRTCVRVWHGRSDGRPPLPGEPADPRNPGHWSKPYCYTTCPTSRAN